VGSNVQGTTPLLYFLFGCSAKGFCSLLLWEGLIFVHHIYDCSIILTFPKLALICKNGRVSSVVGFDGLFIAVTFALDSRAEEDILFASIRARIALASFSSEGLRSSTCFNGVVVAATLGLLEVLITGIGFVDIFSVMSETGVDVGSSFLVEIGRTSFSAASTLFSSS
jgi:hypothetical protein